MNIQSKVKLNNSNKMPILALGVWQAGNQTKQAVLSALEMGYRHIDTAAVYGNEEEVGKAIKESGVPRKEIFITTKLWNEDIRLGKTREALMVSLNKLGLDYIDLYLIHWPANGYVDAYLEMEKLVREGYIKNIGVSNFKKHHLENLLSQVHVIPAVNQIEFNPRMQDEEIYKFCQNKGIVLEAWSPLGSGTYLKIPEIQTLAERYHKTSAQIILRWLVQKGIVILPKSVHEERIIENAQIFDFELKNEDMYIVDTLNQNLRTGPDPDDFHF